MALSPRRRPGGRRGRAKPVPLPDVLRALAIGSAGGTAFWLLKLPLPWMLGAMTACIAASISGVPLGVPRWLRSSLVVV
ncbi:MAG: hypothetical protein AB7P02_01285, partial [Alphaproteobacteria bacterium]